MGRSAKELRESIPDRAAAGNSVAGRRLAVEHGRELAAGDSRTVGRLGYDCNST